jgi:excisionase family DNA binding protein
MTMPAFSEGLESRLPSEIERAAANQLRRILASQPSGNSQLQFYDEEKKEPATITLMPALSKVLMDLLRHIGSGNAVTIVPYGQMLSTQQAADILNVSRPFLISILEKGDIEHELVGRHRRIRAEALFAYKNARNTTRKQALDKLFEIDGGII